MISLVAAALFFVAIHPVVSGGSLRDTLVARMGERGFQGFFSLLSLVGIVWLSWAYAAAPLIPIWYTPAALQHPIVLLMLPAVLLAVFGITTPSPTAVGGEKLMRPEAVRGVLRITRHPFLWAVALWAFLHMIVNGDVASLILFGALFAVAHIGPRSIDKKRRRAFGERWEEIERVTSSLPFQAIAKGRNRFVWSEIGWWRLALGLVVYGGLIAIHRPLFGVSPFG